MAKIAVGSTDGVNVDTHFGQTEFFYIYETGEDGAFSLLEKRDMRGDSDASQHEARRESLARRLSDVQVVIVRQIGQHALESLRARGVNAIDVSCTVEKAVRGYAKRGRIIAFPEGDEIAKIKADAPKREDCPMRAMKMAAQAAESRKDGGR
jgi:nitrogen fixation protein NifB